MIKYDPKDNERIKREKEIQRCKEERKRLERELKRKLPGPPPIKEN